MRAKLLLVAAIAIALGASANATSRSCNTGPYIVFFNEGNAYLDIKARKILDQTVNAAANCGYAKTGIAGHTDYGERRALGMKRADTVRAYFAGHGIPNEDMTVLNLGSDKPRMKVRTDQPEPQNRRVEIMLSVGFGTSDAQ